LGFYFYFSNMNQLNVFELIVPLLHNGVETAVDVIKAFCKGWAKHWVFQLEQGDSGYKHYQCRMSLLKKRRLPELITATKEAVPPGGHFQMTSLANAKNFDYVMKADTRIDGPWSDKDVELYIPRQFKGLVLRPWQQWVVNRSKIFNDRIINVVYDPEGGHGKSTLASYCELVMTGVDLPPINDAKEIVQAMCDICMGKELRTPNPHSYNRVENVSLTHESHSDYI